LASVSDISKVFSPFLGSSDRELKVVQQSLVPEATLDSVNVGQDCVLVWVKLFVPMQTVEGSGDQSVHVDGFVPTAALYSSVNP
jgi:hypothetical protein